MGINSSSFSIRYVICGIKFYVDTNNNEFVVIGYYIKPLDDNSATPKFKRIIPYKPKNYNNGVYISDIPELDVSGYYLNNIITENKTYKNLTITQIGRAHV